MSDVHGTAIFSPDGKRRLSLERWWSNGDRALVCMANPSKAGAEIHDPTVLRLIELVRALDFGGFVVVNWSDYIATDPAEHRRWLANLGAEALHDHRQLVLGGIRALTPTVAARFVAWGNLVEPGLYTDQVIAAMSENGKHDLYAFELTSEGWPKHPMARGTHRIKAGGKVLWRRAA